MQKTLFLVDDCDTFLMKAKQTLDGLYRVFSFPSADKMFALLEKITPDMILLDIEMPEMNGFQAIKKLKAEPRTTNIPVIFLTASVDEISEMEGFELGAVDYIYKPFTSLQLLNRIGNQFLIQGIKKGH
jgi:putative two-component system response regulator